MDANIDLRKDSFLFPKSNNKRSHGTAIIASQLNKRKIYTVLDLINTKESDYSSKTRQQYMAIKEILRYKYFGKTLMFDILFDKKYPKNEIGYKRFSKDIKTLGFRYGYTIEFFRNLEKYFENHLINETEFSMEYMLKKCFLFNNPGPDIRQFYLDYITEKRTKELSDGLKELKNKLEYLQIVRNDFDKQIESVQKQINMLTRTKEK